MSILTYAFVNLIISAVLSKEIVKKDLPICGHFVFGPRRYSTSPLNFNFNSHYSAASERLIYIQDNITITGYTTQSTDELKNYRSFQVSFNLIRL